MFRKILILIISISITFAPLTASAQETSVLEGRVTAIDEGAPSPYSGILLDSIAASKMLVDKKYIKLELELELRKEFHKDLAEKRLAYDLLKTDHDSLRKIHEDTLILKENQISYLNDALKDEMSDYSHWWLASGIALGIILSVAVFYASVEIRE